MRFHRIVSSALLCLLSCSSLVLAGPGGFVELANLTPYDWKLNYTHSYHMDWKFPLTIPAGTTQERYIEWWYDHGPNGDCGAEATYELVGSPNPASFTVQARQNNGKRIEIQYGDELSSIGNPVGSLITLGYMHDGTVFFVLAGNETSSYISTNGPVAWQQATLSTIGTRSLREIAMPASHDAGMSQVTRFYGGVAHNTQTQSVHIYQQLVYGTRWFDIRPVIRKEKWYTNHLSAVPGLGCQGAFGRTIPDIIKDINRFTAENPGELIILELSHEMDRYKWKPRLTNDQWQKLYNLLYSGIDDIWMADLASLPEDLSTVPIKTFIQPGSKSAVLIRVPDHAPGFNLTVQKRDLAIDNLPGGDATQGNNTAIDEPLDLSAPSIVPGNSTLDGDEDDTPDTTDDSSSNTAPPRLPELPSHKTPKGFTPAFIPARRLPTVGSYSDTDSPTFLETDQLAKLTKYRPSPDTRMHQSTWTITQRLKHILDVGNPSTSIIADAVPAHRKLFSKIWTVLSSKTYPNLIEVDDIHDNQITALCMAINKYFAMGRDLHVSAGMKRLAKRRMVPMIRGRPGDEVRERNEWVGKRMEWFVKAIWCLLKIEGRPCWTNLKVQVTETTREPLNRVTEFSVSEVVG
ncbi:hypothetical protein BKA64DRAFT_775714 [Cadophora sp. MPI-SDFR-AT-0126]|nr:hypothetical protein BKA64DRAFT_775714 [Leotiomycetes sp. MPI-SDFR-AT-0126]